MFIRMSWWQKLNWPLNLKHITDAERQALSNVQDWDMYCSWSQHKVVRMANWVRKEMQDKDAYYTLFSENRESWDFTAWGWTVVNDTINERVVWQADKHDWDYSCYISDDWWTTAWYDNSVSQVSHIYKDVTVPAWITDFALKAFWKTVWENNYDRMEAFITPVTVTPNAWTEINSTYSIWKFNGSNSWNESTILRWNQDAWNTIRLVISWRNDWSVWTNPWGLFDELYLLYK